MISKSKYLIGLKCLKYLWIVFNEKERIPKPDISTQHKFDEGYMIDEIAKSLFPDGIAIEKDDFLTNIRETRKYLSLRKPLFEAGFEFNNLYARADILLPVNKDEWDFVEIKSSTKVKDIHKVDVAFQKYCYQKAGLKIRNCFLMYVNNNYVKKGRLNPEEMLIKENITEDLNEFYDNIAGDVNNFLRIINKKICPEIKINIRCKKPYLCPLKEECWSFVPEDSVFTLYNSKKSFEYYNQGFLKISDLPEIYKLSDIQKIQRECLIDNRTNIEKKGISEFLNNLEYPLYLLDFETYSSAVPYYDNSRPYQKLCFQFSLHIFKSLYTKPKHYSFLGRGKKDPRIKLIKKMKRRLGNKGSIIVYNDIFEKSRLKELGNDFPENKDWVDSILKRIVDLIQPFRAFHYYNPVQHGTCSLKDVLPAITGKNYKDLEIQDGKSASLQYLFLVHGKRYGIKYNIFKKWKIRKNLKLYCGRDTEAMIWILRELDKLC